MKWTESTLMVTHGPRASVLADSPAQMSIQDSTCTRVHGSMNSAELS